MAGAALGVPAGRVDPTLVIAIEDGFPVGAAWFRLFSRDKPGYGFVDEATPELAIAVVPSRRGRGIGDALLASLLGRARNAGYPALSLCVDKRNDGAIRVYGRHGFERTSEHDDTLTLRAPLAL